MQHDAEHAEQHEQQREERGEGVVGDQRGQVARLVVTELLPDRDRHGQPGVLLLEHVYRPEYLFHSVHA